MESIKDIENQSQTDDCENQSQTRYHGYQPFLSSTAASVKVTLSRRSSASSSRSCSSFFLISSIGSGSPAKSSLRKRSRSCLTSSINTRVVSSRSVADFRLVSERRRAIIACTSVASDKRFADWLLRLG